MKKKNEVEIQSKGIEQKSDGKYKYRITHVTPLNFNVFLLIAIFLKKNRVFSPTMPHAKATACWLKSKTKMITSRYW